MSRNREAEMQATLAEVLRRASYDLEFRSLALKNPSGAIATVCKGQPASGVEYRFVENAEPASPAKKGVTVLVLPEFVSSSGEISEAELDQVAGGCDVMTCCMTM